MEEMGYHPNIMAKSLVSKTTESICVILPKPAEELFLNLFFMELIRGIVTQANRSGYDVVLSSGGNEKEEVEAVSRSLTVAASTAPFCCTPGRTIRWSIFSSPTTIRSCLWSEKYPDLLSVDTDNVQAPMMQPSI